MVGALFAMCSLLNLICIASSTFHPESAAIALSDLKEERLFLFCKGLGSEETVCEPFPCVIPTAGGHGLRAKALSGKGQERTDRDFGDLGLGSSHTARVALRAAAFVAAASRSGLRLRGGGRLSQQRAKMKVQAKRRFLQAASRGNRKQLLTMLKHNVDPHGKDRNDLTALHRAAMNNHAEIVEELHRRGADVNAKDKDGRTPLHWASAFGRQDALIVLCKLSANLHSRDEKGKTAIGVAAEMQQEWAAEFLKRELVKEWVKLPQWKRETWKPRFRRERISVAELQRLVRCNREKGKVKLRLGRPLWRSARKILL